MRIVFMGTPNLAAGVLPSLADAHDVVGVITRPDAIRGRGKKLVPSPVKQRAQELNLDVYTPETLRTDEAQRLIASLEPDAICVVAYGAILPKSILDIPRFGCLNAHTSLLPRWRGAAPIQRAILAGDETLGVSIMKMEEGLDTGPYCLQYELSADEMHLPDIEEAFAQKGAQGFLAALEQIESGTVEWVVQREEGVTYAQKIDKAELLLDPSDSALRNIARVRASSDAHPARATLAGRTLTVIRAHIPGDEAAMQDTGELAPGQAIFKGKRLYVRASDEVLELKTVKPDGKRAMDAKAFAAGLQQGKNTVLSWGRA